jgi:hypothetical protein
MEHPIIALVAPLSEVNPLRYWLDQRYRSAAQARLGRRASRIVIYQTVLALLVASAIAYLLLVAAASVSPRLPNSSFRGTPLCGVP